MARKLHLMWDLETQDTVPSAIVVSIGACVFDPNSDFIAEQTFYDTPNREVQELRGRTSSESTMRWWSEQSEEARAVFNAPQVDPRRVLVNLADYIGQFDIEGVWGNGSDFDNTIMASFYKSYSIEPPWKFWKNRCHRTMKAIAQSTFEGYAGVRRLGTHHNALDDAMHQARELQAIVKALNIKV